MERTLVSVIIPVFNAEKYLIRAITSVLEQTWSPIEIIVIDDGSNDNSLTQARSVKEKNIRVLTQGNKGAAAARNRGLQAASGKFIQFLDADDLLSSDKIRQQMELLEGAPGFVAAGPTVHFRDGEDPDVKIPAVDWYRNGTDDSADFLVKQYGGALIGPDYGGMVALHAWLIPRCLIDTAGAWNEGLSLDDDGEFMCRILLASSGIKYADQAVSYYRKYLKGNNISSTTTYSAHFSLLQSVKLRAVHLLKKRDDELARKALNRVFGEIAVSFYPEYPQLTKEAERLAFELYPHRTHFPYKNSSFGFISTIFGWKFMRRISKIKSKWLRKRY